MNPVCNNDQNNDLGDKDNEEKWVIKSGQSEPISDQDVDKIFGADGYVAVHENRTRIAMHNSNEVVQWPEKRLKKGSRKF